VTGKAAAIVSLSDGSFELQPSFSVSLSNEMDLILGAVLNFGLRPNLGAAEIRSEFGTIPDSLFLEWKYYF
jgi:hypothetical protein